MRERHVFMRTTSLRKAMWLVGLLGVGGLAVFGHDVSASTLYRRLEGEPATLNPILQTTEVEELVLATVSRNLVDVDPQLRLTPGLCDRWTISPDLREYTFHLRDEATWEDGSPVTAQDALATLRLLRDPRVSALRYASGLESLQSAHAVDRKTFQVLFSAPYALRLFAFHIGLVPAARHARQDAVAAPENRVPVANGPYRVATWRTGQEIVLERNQHYWGQRAAYDRIVYRILPDQEQAYRALLRGELDETRLSADQAAAAMQDPRFARCCRVLQYPNLSFLYLAYNHRKPKFQDARVRRALTMLLDRQAIVDRLYGGAGRVISGPWPTSLSAYDPAVTPYPFDPARARSLLLAAGWQPTSRGLLRVDELFTLRLLYTAASITSREIAEITQASLATVGITCTPEGVDWPNLNARLATGDFDAAVLAFANDPNPDLFQEWHSSQAAPHGLNASGYRKPRVDALIELARNTADEARRTAAFHELHRLLHDEEPATWLCEVAERHAVSRRVDGITVSPAGLFRFWPGATAWYPAGSVRGRDRAAAIGRQHP